MAQTARQYTNKEHQDESQPEVRRVLIVRAISRLDYTPPRQAADGHFIDESFRL